MPDTLTLQIRSLLCVSLAAVQGNCPIFMEIRDNIHQLSFTSFIFISFPRINSIRSSSTVSKILEECFFFFSFLDCWDRCEAQIFAMRTLSNTHSLNLRGRANFIWPSQSCKDAPQGFAHFFLEEEKWGVSFFVCVCVWVPLALPASSYATTAGVYLQKNNFINMIQYVQYSEDLETQLLRHLRLICVRLLQHP